MKKLTAMILILTLLLGLSTFAFADSGLDIEALITNANSGDSQAMADLGMAYFEGTELKKNYSKALEWLQKAVDAGKAECYYTIGAIYEKGGDGVAQNMDEAMSWYNKAAENGDEDAQVKLGLVTRKSTPETEKKKPSMIRLDGVFAEPELIRGGENGGLENPFYLDSPVKNCTKVKLSLAVEEKQGICTGNYYLYVKDTEGKWHHTSVFRLRDYHINGDPVVFDLDLDQPETFVAVALWPADKGMDFTAIYDYAIYASPDCVTSFSSDIPKFNYNATDMTRAVISLHFKTSAYRNPFVAFAEWVNDVLGPGGIQDWGDVEALREDMEYQRLHPDEIY